MYGNATASTNDDNKQWVWSRSAAGLYVLVLGGLGLYVVYSPVRRHPVSRSYTPVPGDGGGRAGHRQLVLRPLTPHDARCSSPPDVTLWAPRHLSPGEAPAGVPRQVCVCGGVGVGVGVGGVCVCVCVCVGVCVWGGGGSQVVGLAGGVS